MFNKTSFALQLVFLAVLSMLLVTVVEARYCCCLLKFPQGGYTSYCDNTKSSKYCKNAGLTWYDGFAGIGNGCDVGNWDSKDVEDRRKISAFENGCGGRFTYKCY
jgi:hypothetical protein